MSETETRCADPRTVKFVIRREDKRFLRPSHSNPDVLLMPVRLSLKVGRAVKRSEVFSFRVGSFTEDLWLQDSQLAVKVAAGEMSELWRFCEGVREEVGDEVSEWIRRILIHFPRLHLDTARLIAGMPFVAVWGSSK